MDDLEVVWEGRTYRVSMSKSVAKEFKRVEAAQRARLLKWMRFFADNGFEFLDSEKLKHEGKFSLGDRAGTLVSIYAFKAWQKRVCGGLVSGNHFVATEIDMSKKQDKADRQMFERAARKLLPFVGGE